MNTKTEEKEARKVRKPVITETVRTTLKQEVDEFDNSQKVTSTSYPAQPADPGMIRKIKRFKNVLTESEPDSYSQWDKQKMEKRKELLKEWLQKRMTPSSQLGQKDQYNGVPNREFQKAAQHMATNEMSAEFQAVAEEYKWICRELGQHDDANLENIRPQTL